MSRDIVASDLMVRDFAKIGTNRPIREAIWTLTEIQADPTFPNALVATDQDGGYAGLLTAKLLLRRLIAHWMPSKQVLADEALLEQEMLAAVSDKLGSLVADALIRGLPVASPNDRLLPLIQMSCEARLEFVPVVENGVAIGLVPITELFNTASALALTPEDEGIQIEA